MLATIGIIILVLWLAGLLFHVAGGIIHIALVIGVILIILHFVRGRSAV
ncbi:MAG: lmo0937 family membrane protein [Sphingomicrobium sp.]